MPRRGSRPIIQLIGNLAKIAIPLAIIAYGAMWFLNLDATPQGELRISTSVPGAEVHIDGKQTGALSDTVLTDVPIGRRLITVRAPGYISEPEVAIVEIQQGRMSAASFVLRDSAQVVKSDKIVGRGGVRQEIFSDTDQAMRSIPAAPPRTSLLDFSDPSVEEQAGWARDSYTDPKPVNPQPRTESSLPMAPDVITDADRQALLGTQITVTSEPPGAAILVNSARTTNSTPHTFRGLDRGYYVFSLELEGHLAKPDSIEIVLGESNQSELAAFSLEPLQKLPVPQLSVSTKPLAAGIRVNGAAVGIGSIRVSADYGSCVIEFAEVPGYRTPDPVQISITADHPDHEIIGTYERLSGSAMLAVVPNEEFPRFDGKKLRIFVDNELILDGPADKFDATLLGSLYPGERAIRVVYEDLVVEDIVRLIDGQVAEATMRIDAMFGKRKLKLKVRTDIPLEKWQARYKKSSVLTQS